ncbi:Anthranilate phosphoribosyltransferase like [hydrothermal vent metagenome]|uniref:Anthranilate phosphoribosyltransferase like n=1 Tax=hydrothermal vent metagenome TaxID=652676 RepID=A0A3B0YDG4_9ZZZZ
MNTPAIPADTDLQATMRSIIQRIATGPELSKDISQEEARIGTTAIFENQVDPVRAAIFFIALRMKRETAEENRGVLDAIRDYTNTVTADVDEIVDLADPYDGYNRTLPAAPFLPALLATCGAPTVSHGVASVGPKYGVTHRHVMAAAGVPVDLTTAQAVARLADPDVGWSYIDQAQFCPKLHDLVMLRQKMIKRPVLTTVEVLAKPVMGRQKTHFVTGYVHKPYPPIYAMLARHVGFDSALLLRGTEGGVIPSLRQTGKYFAYHNKGKEQGVDVDPTSIGIQQELRAAALPDNLPEATQTVDEVALKVNVKAAAQAAADAGIAALKGEKGATYDSLVYAGAIILMHLGKHANLQSAADRVRSVLDSGAAAERII